MSPDLPAAWWDQWSPLCELSSRQAVAAAGGGAMAGRQQVAGAAGPAGGLVASVASSEQSQGGKMQPAAQGGAAGGAGGLSSGFAASGLVNDIGGARCSMGTAFLQHFLDKLGCDSTFG